MSTIELHGFYLADAAAAADKPLIDRARVAAFVREAILPRLVAVAVLLAFGATMYILLSFHRPLRPSFSTAEIALGLVLIALVVRRV